MLKTLVLRDFRCFDKHTVRFESECNVLVGPNGVGKTSLLEALYFLSCGRSFRSGKLLPLVRKERPFFFLQCQYTQLGVEHSLKACYGKEVKQVSYNSTKYGVLSALFGKILITIFSPLDIELVRGGPVVRREYLDLQLAQLDPLYLFHWGRYHKALKQRNHLLKIRQVRSMEAWEAQMAVSALYLIRKRAVAIHALSQIAKQMYRYISKDGESLSVEYSSIGMGPEMDEEQAKQKWIQSRNKDFAIGTTSLGPHKDEIIILLDGSISKTFASEGQMRTIACSLRLAQWHYLQEQTKNNALFLGDDIGISLDRSRKEVLLALLQDTKKQIILTSAEELPFTQKGSFCQML